MNAPNSAEDLTKSADGSAIAERLWSQQKLTDEDSMYERMDRVRSRIFELGISGQPFRSQHADALGLVMPAIKRSTAGRRSRLGCGTMPMQRSR